MDLGGTFCESTPNLQLRSVITDVAMRLGNARKEWFSKAENVGILCQTRVLVYGQYFRLKPLSG